MKRITRLSAWLLSAVLCLGLFLPQPAQAAPLYFTALNDNIPPLTASTMPVWSGGTLYVPYTVFDANLNGVGGKGVDLGLFSSYNRQKNTVTIMNLRQMLTFDLNDGSCRDDMTGEVYSARSLIRNGLPYLSLSTVCSFFGLEYSYSAIPYVPQGYLVRIKNANAARPDNSFIDDAYEMINRRLREYTQGLSSAETTTPTTPTPERPDGDPDPSPSSTPTYLAFLCESADGISSTLRTLESTGRYAVFFLSPQLIQTEGDLVRRILGSGHSVGILARGNDSARSAQLLEQGRRALEESVHLRTTLAYVPSDQRSVLAQKGWVCWNETLLLSPSPSVGPTSFASSTLNRLGERSSSTYLTLEGGSSAARVLFALLTQLDREHFVIRIPMETRL